MAKPITVVLQCQPKDIIEETRTEVMRWPWSWVTIGPHAAFKMRWIPERGVIEWAEV